MICSLGELDFEFDEIWGTYCLDLRTGFLARNKANAIPSASSAPAVANEQSILGIRRDKAVEESPKDFLYFKSSCMLDFEF